MKIKNIIKGAFVGILTTCAISCDDNTSNLGLEVMPDNDFTISTQESYPSEISSYKVDSILARSTTAYLGKFTDPYTGTVFQSDFLTQFYCPEGFEFPDKELMKNPDAPEAKDIELNLYYSTYFGDSISPQKLAVYELNKVLLPDELYYTNLDATEFYDASQAPLATQAYTAIDMVNGDSLYETNGVHMVSIKLPKSFGNRIIKSYYDNPENFQNSENFINNVLKGFYIKNEQGDGAILNINYVHLNVYFEYNIESSSGKVDSLITAYSQFIATPEVVQENHFQTDNLEQILEDESCAYIQTPGGIFPEITLPIDDVSLNDTINSASLTIYRKNNLNGTPYQMGTPSKLMMVRKCELKDFFEKQNVPDYKTSYIAYLSGNQYTYSNITNLINYLRRQKRDNPETYNKDEDWNKVVLVPITEVTQTSGSTTTIVRVLHDLSLNFTKLKREDIKLSIIYSKYNE